MIKLAPVVIPLLGIGEMLACGDYQDPQKTFLFNGPGGGPGTCTV